MNHQTRVPEATGMEEATSEKLKVFTHHGAGRGNISGLQGLGDEADDKGSKGLQQARNQDLCWALAGEERGNPKA